MLNARRRDDSSLGKRRNRERKHKLKFKNMLNIQTPQQHGYHANLEQAIAALNQPFLKNQFKLSPRNAEEAVNILFNTIAQKGDQPLQLIASPGIDVVGNPYLYICMRIERQEADMKVPVNDAIVDMVFTYMNGSDELPVVENLEPERVEDERREEWITRLEEKCKAFQAVRKETVEIANDVCYVKVSYRMQRGKITFRKGKVENLMQLLTA